VLGRLTMRAEYQEERRRLEEVSLSSVPQADLHHAWLWLSLWLWLWCWCWCEGEAYRVRAGSFDGPLNWQLRKELPEALSLLFGIRVAKMYR